MAVAQNDRLDQYISAGGTTVYNYTFPISNENDLKIDLLRAGVTTTLVLNTDYTVTGVGNAAGGTIVLTAPDLVGDTYAIYGINEYRTGTYAQAGDFLAADVNQDMDHIVEICQQNRRDIDRSIRIPLVDTAVNLELPVASERANKYLGFGIDGSILVSESIGIDTDMTATVDGDIVVWDGTNADKVKSADQAVRVPAGTTAQRPLPQAGMIRYNTSLSQIEGHDGGAWVNLLTSGTGAPIGATYIVQQSDGVLTNEQALDGLPTGLMKNTNGTGIITIANQGVDYYAPGGTDVAIADGGTGASTAAGARANLGLGNMALQDSSAVSIVGGAITGITPLGIGSGGTGGGDAATARTNLGLAIGSDVQAYSASLNSMSSLGTAANKMLYTTAPNTWAESDITAAGRAILDDADAATQRATLGLTIGTNVQAHSARLDNVAAIGTSGLVVFGGSNTATARTIIGSNGISVTNGDGVAGNPAVAVDINGLTADLAPDGAADYVMTYDASAGTNKKVLLNNLPGGGGSGGGKILQVVTATKTDTATTSSTSFTDISGLSVTLSSLQSSSSRVLILVTLSIGGGNAVPGIQILRGSTPVGIGDVAGSRARVGTAQYIAGAAIIGNLGLTFVDSPATTASTTYKVQWRVASSTVQLNRSGDDTDSSTFYRGISSLTVMEIGA